jgi:hypothetical protein
VHGAGTSRYGHRVSSSWLESDRDAKRPEWADIKRSHDRVTYEAYAVESPAVTALLDALRETHDNGGAMLAGFRVNADDVIGWFASRNRLKEYDLFPHFLGSQAVRDALPELQVPQPLGRELGFEPSWTGTLTIDGELAARLVHGGAYDTFEGSATEAKRLGAAFVDALVGDRHTDFKVYRSDEAWAPWFCDIAWDTTWILVDRRTPTVLLLCLTDTD